MQTFTARVGRLSWSLHCRNQQNYYANSSLDWREVMQYPKGESMIWELELYGIHDTCILENTTYLVHNQYGRGEQAKARGERDWGNKLRIGVNIIRKKKLNNKNETSQRKQKSNEKIFSLLRVTRINRKKNPCPSFFSSTFLSIMAEKVKERASKLLV